MSTIHPNVSVTEGQIALFCTKWRITELELFGSVLGDDFRRESDIDVLVTFALDTQWSLFDAVQMEDELKLIFGRDVDVVTRRSIERSRNYLRRQDILGSARRVYAATG